MIIETYEDKRARLFLRYLVEVGSIRRWGASWRSPERVERLEYELGVIEKAGFSPAFVMLAGIIDFCRAENIPYGMGRGSVGGSLVAYTIGIHEADSLEFGLFFERFLNPERVSFPDVDLDFSQRHRDRVLAFIRERYERDGQHVLQVAAFARAGARKTVDTMAAAMSQNIGSQAFEIAATLKRCLPEGNITGGKKIQRELSWWLEEGHGDRERFRKIATDHNWLEPMLKIDGMFTHLGRHAAGVVILRQQDLNFIPQTSPDGKTMATGYDMHALDSLGYLKWDILGLRTLDVIAEADILSGGDGSMDHLIQLWKDHRDDEDVYELLQEADTVGIFQMETDGYRRTLRDFQPTSFDHLVQLVALYRPGAIDYHRASDGKNMVEVFIDRMHGREKVEYLHPSVAETLKDTHGVLLYQEQQMQMVRAMAGFTMSEADRLRRAIGKKKIDEMNALRPLWESGTAANGIDKHIADAGWENISAAARYSWNKAHAVEYGIVTWLTCWFKSKQKAAFYCALINSFEDKRDRQVDIVSEARQRVEIVAPAINTAESGFTIENNKIVFGMNGIKGMGDAIRSTILRERLFYGPFTSYWDFCKRLPSVGTDKKKALIACGAFDAIETEWTRDDLLSTVPKSATSDKVWTLAEFINHNTKLKNERPVPSREEWVTVPTEEDMAKAELGATGYYISRSPMAKVEKAITRCPMGTIGGKVEKITTKKDKRGQTFCYIHILTPALEKKRVLVFASLYSQYEHRDFLSEMGHQILVRGVQDGGAFKSAAIWRSDDYRHFKKLRISRGDDKPEYMDFDGQESTIVALEDFGYSVRCL